MKKILVLIILTICYNVYAQDSISNIDAQRPTLTESNTIIQPNIVQFENGLDYWGKNRTFTYGTFIRGSLNSFVELRLMTDYRNVNYVGGKFSFMKTDKSVIGLGGALVYHHMLDTTNDDVRLALTRDFKNVSLTYNFGYNGNVYQILYVGTFLSKNVCSFIEYYNDPVINRIHGGIMYYPIPDIQLDVNGGWIDQTGWYSGIGLSFRFR